MLLKEIKISSAESLARYYEPNSGRFLSADPLGQGVSPSLYDFAGGDPVNRFDPNGRLWGEIGSTIYQTFASGAQTIQAGFAQAAGYAYGDSQAGSAVAGQYFNQAMNNSVSGQVLAAGGSQAQAQWAANTLRITAATEVSVFGGAGLLSAYQASNIGTGVYISSSAILNGAIGTGNSLATQELSTGYVNWRQVGFSGTIGAAFGGVSGLLGVRSTLIEEEAVQIESNSASIAATGRYLDYTQAEIDAANTLAEQAAISAAGQTAIIELLDAVGLPPTETAIEQWLSGALGFENSSSGNDNLQKGCPEQK